MLCPTLKSEVPHAFAHSLASLSPADHLHSQKQQTNPKALELTEIGMDKSADKLKLSPEGEPLNGNEGYIYNKSVGVLHSSSSGIYYYTFSFLATQQTVHLLVSLYSYIG